MSGGFGVDCGVGFGTGPVGRCVAAGVGVGRCVVGGVGVGRCVVGGVGVGRCVGGAAAAGFSEAGVRGNGPDIDSTGIGPVCAAEPGITGIGRDCCDGAGRGIAGTCPVGGRAAAVGPVCRVGSIGCGTACTGPVCRVGSCGGFGIAGTGPVAGRCTGTTRASGVPPTGVAARTGPVGCVGCCAIGRGTPPDTDWLGC